MCESTRHERQVRELKRLLRGWQYILIQIWPILMWKNIWDLAIISGFITAAYLFIWLIDLSTISTVALVGMLISLGTFLKTFLSQTIYKSSWTHAQDTVYEEICSDLIAISSNVTCIKHSLQRSRLNNPLLFYPLSIGVLFFILWITAGHSDFFILYMLTIGWTLLPSIQKSNIYQTIIWKLHLVSEPMKELTEKEQ